jgi:hypothetical protein
MLQDITNTKFGFKDALATNIALPMKEQKSLLVANIVSWQGNLEQVDDILIIGIRI